MASISKKTAGRKARAVKSESEEDQEKEKAELAKKAAGEGGEPEPDAIEIDVPDDDSQEPEPEEPEAEEPEDEEPAGDDDFDDTEDAVGDADDGGPDIGEEAGEEEGEDAPPEDGDDEDLTGDAETEEPDGDSDDEESAETEEPGGDEGSDDEDSDEDSDDGDSDDGDSDDFEVNETIQDAILNRRKRYRPNTVGAVIELLKKSDPEDKLMIRLSPGKEECMIWDVSRKILMNGGVTYMEIAKGSPIDEVQADKVPAQLDFFQFVKDCEKALGPALVGKIGPMDGQFAFATNDPDEGEDKPAPHLPAIEAALDAYPSLSRLRVMPFPVKGKLVYVVAGLSRIGFD